MTNSSTQPLEIEDLKVQYPNSSEWILDGFNLRINVGEKVALIGRSGCGKSTLARVILGLLPPGSICRGNVIVAGQSLQGIDFAGLQKLRGESVGLVFQDPMTRLNPLMTIGNHLLDTINAHSKKISYEARRQRAEELLERVGIDLTRFDSYPHEFSGGMRQRLSIALAIALNPCLVIADEPTTSLDSAVSNQIMTELSRLCDSLGSSLLLVSHDLALASRWCDRMAILDQGRIVENSSSLLLLTQTQSEIGKSLVTAARALEGAGERNILVKNSSIALEVERLRCWHSIVNWPWKFNWLKAVDEVSFSISEGETLGLVGVSGCGKSTLCRALMGLIPIRGGTVKLQGKDLFALKGSQLTKARKLIQMVFQDPLACLNPKMKIGDAICDPFLIHNLGTSSQAKAHTKDLLRQVGLCPPEYFYNRFPQELSGGQLQRVVIARALSLNPKILICDESVSMLDAEVQSEILKLLRTLQKKFGLTILFVTHDLVVANGFCDRLIILDKGRIIEEGSASQIFRAPQMPLTKRLIEACPRLP